MTEDWRGDVLRFWFGLGKEQWWRGGPKLDEEIRSRFLQLWEEKRQLPAHCFLDDPLSALAAVILFDQFPRNMFRGHADQFSTDPLALAIAREAVDFDLDEQLNYAKLHHDIIERFGRFPHRNQMLGRAPRPAEAEAGEVVPW